MRTRIHTHTQENRHVLIFWWHSTFHPNVYIYFSSRNGSLQACKSPDISEDTKQQYAKSVLKAENSPSITGQYHRSSVVVPTSFLRFRINKKV